MPESISSGPSRDGPFFLRRAARCAVASLALSCLALSAPPTPAATPEAAAIPLEDTRWSLVAVGATPARASATAAYILLRRGESGRFLGGTGGCNGLKGSYDAFAGRLRITAAALTGRTCATPLASQETKLVEALRQTAAYRIQGNVLTLLGADGRTLARFAARP